MYFSLCTLSQNKTNYNHDCELACHTWKMSPHYLMKCRTHSPDGRYIVSLQTLVALKRSGCVMWQLECQASNVTASICSTWAWGRHWVFLGGSLRLASTLLVSLSQMGRAYPIPLPIMPSTIFQVSSEVESTAHLRARWPKKSARAPSLFSDIRWKGCMKQTRLGASDMLVLSFQSGTRT